MHLYDKEKQKVLSRHCIYSIVPCVLVISSVFFNI